MDQQSTKPMLGGAGAASGRAMEVESGNIGRVPSTHSFFKRNSNKGLIIGLILTIILCVILFIALCLVSIVPLQSFEDHVCITPQCIRTASSLLSSMDHSVQPCDDFYKHICGQWHKRHVLKDTEARNGWFEESTWLINRNIQSFLEEPNDENEPESVHKARGLYKSCLDLEKQEEAGAVALAEILNKIGLSFIPPLEAKPQQSWLKTAANAKKYLDIDIIIGLGYAQVPKNSSQLRLVVNAPTANSELSTLKKKHKANTGNGDDDDDDELEEEDEAETKANLLEYLKYFLAIGEHHITDVDVKLKDAVEDLYHMLHELKLAAEDPKVLLAQQNTVHEEIYVDQLQDIVDLQTRSSRSKIKWKQYFNALYEGSSIKLDFDRSDKILKGNEPYLKEVAKVLDFSTEHQIELYSWYLITKTLAPHTNLQLSSLAFKIDGKIPDPRPTQCTDSTMKLMKTAVTYYLVRQADMDEKSDRIRELVNSLREQFISLVKDIKWMDEKTKEAAIEKILAMKLYIGFFDFMKNKAKVDELYEEVKIQDNAYLSNVISVMESSMKRIMPLLRESYHETMLEHDMIDINAFYTQSRNYIFIPAGILDFPFYNMGLEALNYGAIGVILGHELTHGFDDTGRLYDKDGNYHKWWSNESDAEYTKRSQCFINKYNKYFIPSVNKSVDGALTLGENIADHGGLSESFLAYKKYVENSGEEKQLIHFQNYTHEQLFFMSFAHNWCSEYTNEDGIKEALADVHTPDFARTMVALQNMPEFSEVWNCPKGSHMNPEEEKCNIWID